jgi:hypothetical protein
MQNKIKFTTDEYRTKYYTNGNYCFHVYPYGKGEWTLSLYEYGAREIKYGLQMGFHFVMELGFRPLSIKEVREEIIKFLTTKHYY